MPGFAHLPGQRCKAFGSDLGDVAAGDFGPETLGVQPDAPQQGQLVGLGQLGQQHGEPFSRVAGELGLHAKLQSVAHHQNRRVAEGAAVIEQLLERAVEVFAGGFVFPGKSAAPENVGIATRLAQHQGLLFKNIAVFTARPGHAQHVAQVNKVALRALLLVEVKRRAAWAPFGDEVLWGHVDARGFLETILPTRSFIAAIASLFSSSHLSRAALNSSGVRS